MANISHSISVSHVITPAEESAFGANIPILWPSSFNDTNYAIHISLEVDPSVNAAYEVIASLTPAGFLCKTLAAYTAGQTVVVHALAVHL